MESVLETSMRTILGFCVLLLLTRFLGKKQLGQLTYFTYITGIAMGNIAGDMVVHRDIGLADGIAGLCIWAVLTFVLEYASLKNAKLRVILDGEPTIVISKGRIIQDQLGAHRLNMDDLTMMLRVNNVFSINDIDYAILEPNGELSILKKSDVEPVRRQDLNLKQEIRAYLPTELISDGRLIKRNFKEVGITEEWLYGEIQKQGYTSFKQVFFAELQSDGTLFVEAKQSR